MNKLNKRVLLSAGTIVMVAAPVVTVISCGDTYEPSQEDMDAYRDLTSPLAYKFVESVWQEKVISEIIDKDLPEADRYQPKHELIDDPAGGTMKDPNDPTKTIPKKIPQHTYWTQSSGRSVYEAAKYVVVSRIQADGEYLKKMADTLSQSGKDDSKDPSNTSHVNRYSKEWLRDNGILNTYSNGVIKIGNGVDNTDPDKTNNGLTEAGLEFIFQSDKLTFKSEVYKFMITTWYIENTDKAHYELAFKSRVNEGTSDINRVIDPSNYLLIKEMISNKYFAKWEIELTPEFSRQFTDSKAMYFDDVIQYLYADKKNLPAPSLTLPGLADFNTLVKRSDMMKQFRGETFKPLDNKDIQSAGGNATLKKYQDLIGYQGISAFTAVGSETLSFTLDKMKEVTNVTPGADGSLGTPDDGKKDAGLLSTNWDGFLVKDNLNRATLATVDKDHSGVASEDEMKKNAIPLMVENGETVKLTYLHGIMPVWNGNNFVLNLPVDAAPADVKTYKHSVAQLMAILKTDYYNDAVDYLRSEGNNGVQKKDSSNQPIQKLDKNGQPMVDKNGRPVYEYEVELSPTILDVKNDQYKKLLLDAGYKFVDTRKV